MSTARRIILLTSAMLSLFSLSALGDKSSSCSPAQIALEQTHRLSDAVNEMALGLYRQLSAGNTDNVFFSPFSLATAFGMLFYGTRGDTARELRNALGYDKAELPDELVHDTFNHLLKEMLKDSPNSPYTLNAANAVLLDKRLELVSNYKSDIARLYGAAVKEADFVNDSPQVVREVNEWVRRQTHGKIGELLSELSPSTAMVLLNAVYFKGTWMTEFRPEKTKMQKFYNRGLESEAKEVPLMHMTHQFYYSRGDGHQLLELVYKGDNVSMFVLLPDKRDGLEDIERSLTPERLQKMFHDVFQSKVVVTLPKFKVEYSKELSSEFQTLGARKVFQAGSADFTGMTPHGGSVFVSEVRHKAVVEVNEEGSEAAVVTGVISNRMFPIFDSTPEFTADHPFLYFIRDRITGVILFMGRIESL